jgi:hypothetical protein
MYAAPVLVSIILDIAYFADEPQLSIPQENFIRYLGRAQHYRVLLAFKGRGQDQLN